MPKAEFKLVALDVDGTLVDSRGRVSDRLKRALLQLAERGVRAVLCTGRRWRTAWEVLQEIEHAHVVAVSCAGALIKDGSNQRTLHTTAMPRAAARRVAAAMRAEGLVPFVLMDVPLEGRELLISEADHERASALPYIRANAEFVEYYEGEFPRLSEEPIEVYTMDDVSRVRPVERALQDRLSGIGTATAMLQARYGPTQWALEVHDPAATKWNGLCWLLERWRIPAEQVVAVGDDVNDIPMLRAAGLSFAMANAVPEAKAAARRLTASNDEDGAYLALRDVFGLPE
jgi:hypothetical protein